MTARDKFCAVVGALAIGFIVLLILTALGNAFVGYALGR